MKINFRLANQNDNKKLLNILDKNPFSGSISLIFQRKPDYFEASKIEGKYSETLIAEINGKIVKVYGINYLREIIGLLEPVSMEYTYVTKSDNPSEPSPAIFAIKV